MDYGSFVNEGHFTYWMYKETERIANQKNFKCEITNRKKAREYIKTSLELIKYLAFNGDNNMVYFEDELKWLKRELKSMSGTWCYDQIYIMYLLIKQIEKEKKL